MKCILGKLATVMVILAGGAVYDLRDHKIPNWWLGGSVCIGLMIQVLLSPLKGAELWWIPVRFSIQALMVIFLCFPLFRLRMIGGADVKMMAVICGFLNIRLGFVSIVWSFLIGAVMSLLKLLIQKSLIQRLRYLFAYFKRLILTKEVVAYHIPARDGYEHTIPFGLCLFLGTLIAIMTKY